MAFLAGIAIAWIAWAIVSPWLPPLGAAATLAGLAGALFGLHLLATYAEHRGWIYYRARQGSWQAVGAAMAEVQAIYRPEQQYVRELEERRDTYREDDEAGAGTH